MTNFEWIKQEWAQKIQCLTEDELYESMTNGTISGGICKYCETVFPACKDNLENDDICKERFKLLCNMEHQKIEENVHV